MIKEKILLTDEEIAGIENLECGDDYTGNDFSEFWMHEESLERIAKAQSKKVGEYIGKYIFYVDARGYIALKPNATKNWQALLDEVK